MRTDAPSVRRDGAWVGWCGAGGMTVSSGVASEPSARTRRHRMLTWRMVVAALLVGLVLAVGSVPVAVIGTQGPHWPAPPPVRTVYGVIVSAERATLVSLDRQPGYRLWTSWTDTTDRVVSFDPAASLLGDDPRPQSAIATASERDQMSEWISAGWPIRSAWGKAWWSLHPPQLDGLIEIVISGHRTYIPTNPIWPGLLANTLFYAALAMTPMVLLRWRRTRWRRARGLCVACGYELGEGVGVCPECGFGRAMGTGQ